MKIKNIKNQTRAFSLIEISISLIIIFCIMGATIPLMSKRIKSGNHKSKKFGTTQDCNSVVAGSEGYCKFCDPVEKICVVCSRLCPEDKPNLDVEHCTCYKNEG